MQDEVEAIRSEVTDLQTRLRQLNEDLGGLQAIIGEISDGGYAKTTEILPGETSDRLSITFSDGRTVVIGSGRVGEDGTVDGCLVGVREENGVWYWTLNGAWLTDGEGGRLIAVGKDGYIGITPQLKIEDGLWLLSMDGGGQWEVLSPVKGEDGFYVVAAVDPSSDRFIVLTLADGQEIAVPRVLPSALTFPVPSEIRTISAGETLSIPFALEGDLTDSLLLVAGSDGKYSVCLQEEAPGEGTLQVTCPEVYSEGYVYLLADDRRGNTALRVIRLDERVVDWPDCPDRVIQVDAAGGRVDVSYISNFEGSFTVARLDDRWMRAVTPEVHPDLADVLTLQVEANPGKSVRTGTVEIRPKDHPEFVFSTLTVLQASRYFSIDQPVLEAEADGGRFHITMTAPQDISLAALDPDAALWIDRTLTGDGTTYSLEINVHKNRSYEGRHTEFDVYADDGQTLLGSVTVSQKPWNVERRNDMVLTVRANIADNYTVFLPLRGACDCRVDWGDGTVERVERTLEKEDWVFHRYDTSAPETYTVTVSGAVEALNAEGMPDTEGIISIEQWGKLGLRSMDHAFENCTRLTYLPPDLAGAFADITAFYFSFNRCLRLTDISPDLFSQCPSVRSMHATFKSCRSLSALPATLFSACPVITVFDSTFEDCDALTEVPSSLFASCPDADNFGWVFCSSGIRSIPEDLFARNGKAKTFECAFSWVPATQVPGNLFASCPEVESFREVFAGSCLREIPGALFASNPKVKTMQRAFFFLQDITQIPEGTFGQCYRLRSVPTGLFDRNRKVKDFGATFWDLNDCWGETPFSLIDGRKVHLYERILYPDHFVTPEQFADCFGGEHEYDAGDPVPDAWKN